MADEEQPVQAVIAVPSNATAIRQRARQQEIEAAQSQRALDTPRTREACRKLGLVMEDLQFRGFDAFLIPGDPKDKQLMRFEHYEKKRKDRLAQVLAERAKVIASQARKGEVPGAQSGQFLSMLESLFEKEAKRLETDLKSQLRQHGSLVKENEEQLRKEELLTDKLALVDKRRHGAQQVNADKSSRARDYRTERSQRSNAILHAQEDAYHKKQVDYARGILAEEERMERFNEQQKIRSAEKSAHWKAKVERMGEYQEQRKIDRVVEGESRLMEIENKILAVDARREEEQRQRQVRSEEQHLHIQDVRENKLQVDRRDHYRREELRDQIESNAERIETLLALKDQLLDQRKGRALKAAATKGSRGLNLCRDVLPGPGQYEAPASCMTEGIGVKMHQSSAPGMIDEVTKVTAAYPPPGAYETNTLKDGSKVGGQSNAVKFGNRDRKSFLDEAMAAKADVPAPGRYNAKTDQNTRATAFKRERIALQGIDKFDARRFPVWARPGTETPGPAGYKVDDYSRKETLRRAQRSLPNLTRDMLRTGNDKQAQATS